MPIKDYIQGNKRGKEANRLEREALGDPFLQEALDGFDSVAGDHPTVIDRLEKRFSQPTVVPQKNKKVFIYGSIAASVLLLIGFSTVLFLDRSILSDQPDIAFLELQERDILMDSPVLLEEPSQEPLTVAKTTPKITPAPTRSSTPPALEERIPSEKIMVAEADYLADLSEVPAQAKSSAKFTQEEGQATMRVTVQEERLTARRVIVQEESAKSIDREEIVDETIRSAFGEKEFQIHCQQKTDKSVCAGGKTTVKVSFFIDEMGKPSKIEYKRYSCEEAKEEMENLLVSSPAWTKRNRKVTMTIKWDK